MTDPLVDLVRVKYGPNDRSIFEYFPTTEFLTWLGEQYAAHKPLLLDLSGETLLTDEPFLELARNANPAFSNHNKALRDVCKLVHAVSLDGCVHITDYALLHFSKAFPSLQHLSLKGCQNITDEGIRYIMGDATGGVPRLELCGTSVTTWYSGWGEVPTGCPLVNVDNKKGKTGELGSGDLWPADLLGSVKKLVILSSNTTAFSVSDYLLSGMMKFSDHEEIVYRPVVPPMVECVDYLYNVYEIKSKLESCGPVLSEQAVYVIALQYEESVHIKVMEGINTVRAVQQDARVLVLILLGEGDALEEDFGSNLKSVIQQQRETLQDNIQEERHDVVNRHNKGGARADRDFPVQRHYVASDRASHFESKVEERFVATVVTLETSTGKAQLVYPSADNADWPLRDAGDEERKRKTKNLQENLGRLINTFEKMKKQVDYNQLRAGLEKLKNIDTPSRLQMLVARAAMTLLDKSRDNDAMFASGEQTTESDAILWREKIKGVLLGAGFADDLEKFNVQSVDGRRVMQVIQMSELQLVGKFPPEQLSADDPVFLTLWRWLAAVCLYYRHIHLAKMGPASAGDEGIDKEALETKIWQDVRNLVKRYTDSEGSLKSSKDTFQEEKLGPVLKKIDETKSQVALLRSMDNPPSSLLQLCQAVLLLRDIKDHFHGNMISSVFNLAKQHIFTDLSFVHKFDPTKVTPHARMELRQLMFDHTLRHKLMMVSPLAAQLWAWVEAWWYYLQYIEPVERELERLDKEIIDKINLLSLDGKSVPGPLVQIRASAQQEMDRVEPALSEAISMIGNLSKADISEVKSFTKPPVNVIHVLDVVALLHGYPHNPGDWASIKKNFGPQSITMALNYDKEKLTPSLLKSVQGLIDSGPSDSDVMRVSRCAAAFWKWVKAIYEYGVKVQPLARELRVLESFMQKARQDMEKQDGDGDVQQASNVKKTNFQEDSEELIKKKGRLEMTFKEEMDELNKSLSEAVSLLKKVVKADLSEIKAYKSPPAYLIHVFEAFAIIQGQNFTTDSWPLIKKYIGLDSITSAIEYDQKNLKPDLLKKVKSYIDSGPSVSEVKKVSSCALAFWKWVKVTYEIGVKANSMATELATLDSIILKARQDREKQLNSAAKQGSDDVEVSGFQDNPEELNKKKASLETKIKEEMDAINKSLDEAKNNLTNVSRSDMTEIKALRSVPKALGLTWKAICVLLGAKTQDDDDVWRQGQIMAGDPKFISVLKNYDLEPVTQLKLDILNFVMPDDLTTETVLRVSRAGGMLHAWVCAVRDAAQKMMTSVHPLRKKLKLLKKQELSKEQNERSLFQGIEQLDLQQQKLQGTWKRIESSLEQAKSAGFDTLAEKGYSSQAELGVWNAVLQILGREQGWESACKLMTSPTFIEDCKSLNLKALHQKGREAAHGFSISDKAQQELQQASPASHALYQWQQAVGEYLLLAEECSDREQTVAAQREMVLQRNKDDRAARRKEALSRFQQQELSRAERGIAEWKFRNYYDDFTTVQSLPFVTEEGTESTSHAEQLGTAVTNWIKKDERAEQMRSVTPDMANPPPWSDDHYLLLARALSLALGLASNGHQAYQTVMAVLKKEGASPLLRFIQKKKLCGKSSQGQLASVSTEYETMQQTKAVPDELKPLWQWVEAVVSYSFEVSDLYQTVATAKLQADNTTNFAERKGPELLWNLIVRSTYKYIEQEHVHMQSHTWTEHVQTVWLTLLQLRYQMRKVVETKELADMLRDKNVEERTVKVILHKLHLQGFVVYLPQVDGLPVVLDQSWFSKLLTSTLALSDPHSGLANGSRCPALPRSTPLFTRDQLMECWGKVSPAGSQDEFSLCFSALRYYGWLIDAPLQAAESDLEVTRGHYFLFQHLDAKVSLWTGQGEEKISTGHFVTWLWPEDTSSSLLPTDLQLEYWYKFTVGQPAHLLPQILGECTRLGYVQHAWSSGLVARVGAADILIKYIQHGTQISGGLTIQVRMTRIHESASSRVLQTYLWSALSPYLTAIDYWINKHPHLHVRRRIPCRGGCRLRGVSDIISMVNIPRDTTTVLQCSRCDPQEAMTLEDMPYLNGRLPMYPRHDFRDQRDQNHVTNRCAPYHVIWNSQVAADERGRLNWVCGHCGVSKFAANRLWLMQTELMPTPPQHSYRLYEREPRDCDVVYASKHPLWNNGSVTVDVTPVTEDEHVRVVFAREDYFTGQEVFSELQSGVFENVRLLYDLRTGELRQRNPLEEKSKDEAWVVTQLGPTRPGDTWSLVVSGHTLDSGVYGRQSVLLEVSLFRNGLHLITALVPYRTYYGVIITRPTLEAPVQCIYQSPTFPYARAEHFPLGSAVFVKTGRGNQFTVGRVWAHRGGRLLVGTSPDTARLYPTESPELMPIAMYSDVTVVIDGEIITSSNQIIKYLTANKCNASPFGLFLQMYNTKMRVSEISLRGTWSRFFEGNCTVSLHSPAALQNSFEWHMLSAGKSDKKPLLSTILLPHVMRYVDTVHASRQLVQDWTKQTVHILCRGSNNPNPMSGRTNFKDVHFVHAEPAHPSGPVVVCRSLVRKCKQPTNDRVHLHELQASIAAYYFLCNNANILPVDTPASLLQREPVTATLTDEQVSGLYRVLALYKHTFILLSWLFDVHNGYCQNKGQLKPGEFIDQLGATVAKATLDYGRRNVCNSHDMVAKKNTFRQLVADSLGDFAHNIKSVAMSNVNMRRYFQAMLGWFPNIESISLTKCDVRDMGGVNNCRMLRILDLTDNRLEEISPDLRHLKQTLTGLGIGGNPISVLPDFLTELSCLQHLYMGNTLIRALPENIGDLTALRILNCGFTLINTLPESFAKLKNIEILNLSGLPSLKPGIDLITHPEFMKFVKNYTVLSSQEEAMSDLFHEVDTNKTQTLDEEEVAAFNRKLLEMFPRIGSHIAEGSGFPKVILNCHTLRSLVLCNHLVRQVPDEIDQLRRLNKLVLSNSAELEVLSPKVGQLRLSVLDVKDCPKLRTPPQEIVRQGMKVTLAYLKRLSQGSVSCYKTKLMFVGLGGAGKTSLTRALMAPDFKSPSYLSEAITDGIDISTWPVKHGEVELQYSVWDFAGQTVYYNTHQFFLSNRAIYLLVWNTRLGYEHSGLEFWLASIACHCPKAPCFIVGTHADKITKPELPEYDLRKRFDNIAGFFYVSSTTGQGIESLYTELVSTTMRQPYMGEQIPESWLNTGKAIMARRGDSNLLDWSVVESHAMSEGIYGDEVHQAVSFLHELGTVQHWDSETLRDKVVINPQWIVDVMACVVSVHNKVIVDGRLEHKDIGVIWRDYDASLHDWLLRLTEVFDLTFPIRDQPASIVPCLLPQNEPQYHWPCLEEDPEAKETQIVYQFDYLPAGLFNRAQVRLYQFSDSSSMWKTGSVLRKNNHWALVQQTKLTVVVVKVFGQRPENILLLIHEVFESLISEFFRGVKYEYKIPCRDCVDIRTEQPTFFSSKILKKAIELKALFLQCHSFFHILSISEIQGSLPPQSANDYSLQLENAMRDLDDLSSSLRTDVFMLYYSGDLPADPDQSKVVDIRKVKAELEKHHYKCWFAENLAQLSVEQVAMAMKNSRLVLVFVSDEFVEDEHCKRLFQFAKTSLRKDIQLCMVGLGRKWMESNFVGIQVSEQVFVNFQRPDEFASRLQELLRHLKTKLRKEGGARGGDEAEFDVFLSYAWSNSRTALEAGHSKKVPGAIGQGDPRQIKQMLQEAGDLSVWLDIEQVGRKGLYQDIAEGIKQSAVVVACVSDEYALSDNCKIEFRFAHNRRKPIILAVVGTGFKWESTEIGMLSLGYPKINFQAGGAVAEEELLGHVGEALQEAAESREERPVSAASVSNRELAFRELYELAQRKLLRQIRTYTEGRDPYPRIFVCDFTRDPNDKEPVTDSEVEVELDDKPRDRKSPAAINFESLKPGHFCLKTLCEYEGGWHSVSEELPIELTGSTLFSVWRAVAPYMGQLMAILKHSEIDLHVLHSVQGLKLIDNLHEYVSKATNVDVKPIYMALRAYVMRKDKTMQRGKLKRCYTPSGKTLWLCAEHQQLPRITVFDDPEFDPEVEDVEEQADRDAPEIQLVNELEKIVKAGKADKAGATSTGPSARPGSARPKSALKRQTTGTKPGPDSTTPAASKPRNSLIRRLTAFKQVPVTAEVDQSDSSTSEEEELIQISKKDTPTAAVGKTAALAAPTSSVERLAEPPSLPSTPGTQASTKRSTHTPSQTRSQTTSQTQSTQVVLKPGTRGLERSLYRMSSSGQEAVQRKSTRENLSAVMGTGRLEGEGQPTSMACTIL